MGILQSTSLGALIIESGLSPLVALLDYRQSHYAQRVLRQYGNPRDYKVLLETPNEYRDY
jgi:hypothetical protein